MPLYLTSMGYTSRRPDNWPVLDRAAVMRAAHRIARDFRSQFSSYREALAYGLTASWRAARSARAIQSLASRAASVAPLVPPTTSRHRMLGSYAYAGA